MCRGAAVLASQGSRQRAGLAVDMQLVGRGSGSAVFLSEDSGQWTAVTCSAHPNWSRLTSGGSSTRTTAPVGDLCLKMSCLGVPWAKKSLGFKFEIKTAKPGAIRQEGLVAYVQLRGWMWVEVRVRVRNNSTKK